MNFKFTQEQKQIIEDCDEEKALAYLLNNNCCFLNTIKVPFSKKEQYTTIIYVNVNDVFCWGCADAEPISNNDGEYPSEIMDLYKQHIKNNKWGLEKWVCLKRNMQPQFAIKRDMIADNFWDIELESLPKNIYDKQKLQ